MVLKRRDVSARGVFGVGEWYSRTGAADSKGQQNEYFKIKN